MFLTFGYSMNFVVALESYIFLWFNPCSLFGKNQENKCAYLLISIKGFYF